MTIMKHVVGMALLLAGEVGMGLAALLLTGAVVTAQPAQPVEKGKAQSKVAAPAPAPVLPAVVDVNTPPKEAKAPAAPGELELLRTQVRELLADNIQKDKSLAQLLMQSAVCREELGKRPPAPPAPEPSAAGKP